MENIHLEAECERWPADESFGVIGGGLAMGGRRGPGNRMCPRGIAVILLLSHTGVLYSKNSFTITHKGFNLKCDLYCFGVKYIVDLDCLFFAILSC